MQQQLEIKRKREEQEQQEQEEIQAKYARKTDESAVSDAKARYLARKQAAKNRSLPKMDDT